MPDNESAWSSALRSSSSERWSRLDVPGSTARLIRELSWDKIDGRHQEDVLTTEIFQALDFLPRKIYLEDVWNSIHDIPEQNLEPLRSAAETARIITLPGSFNYDDSRDRAEVQPDVLIESPFCVVSVEAKRPTKAKFDPTQLARQALLLSRIAEGRPAYLWVILGSPPPIKLAKLGNQGLMDALGHGLQQIADPALSDLTFSRFDGYLGWSTWKEIVDVCRTKHRVMDGNDIWDECGKRIISSMEDSLRWHS